MFHLFRKVYLDFDSNIDGYKNRIVISSTNGYKDTDDKNFYQGLGVSDLIGEGKEFATELDLFKKCKELSDSGDEQLIVFCDKTSYLHLFIAWHKILLSNIDADSLWSVFIKHVDKETYESTVTGRSENVHYNDLKPSTWSKESFTAQFASISAAPDTVWNNSILEHVSLDYLLTTHLTSTTDLVKAALKNKIQLFVDRTLQTEIYDIKMYAMTRSQDKKLHDILSISEVETVSDFFAAPALSPLSDPSFWDESKKMVASSKEAAITLSNVVNIPALITTLKTFRIDQQGQKEDSIFVTKLDWLNWVSSTLTDEQLSALLVDEDFCASEFVCDSDVHKVNILFIDSVLKLYRTSNTDPLSKYTIAL